MLPLDAKPEIVRKREWLGLSPGAWAALAAIVVFGAVVRFWNLDWDHGAYDFHTDERTLNEMVRRLGPDLNPHFYYYGTLPIYLYRASAGALSVITGVDWLSQTRLLLVGRFYSALASVVTLLFAFAIGRRLWGVRAGLLAAALLSSAALAIQAAHFSTVESLLTLEAVVILWMSLRIMDGEGRRWYVFAGIVLGLAMATKLTAASFAVMPLLAHLVWGSGIRDQGSGIRGQEVVAGEADDSQAYPPQVRKRKWIVDLALFFGCTAVATLVAEPYYILGWNDLWQAIQVQTDELSGASRFSYVWQFIGSTPYLFELKNLVVWGLSVPLGVVALVGWGKAILDFGFWILDLFRVRRLKSSANPDISLQSVSPDTQRKTYNPRYKIQNTKYLIVLIVWPTLYFLYVGTWQARFIRHLMPLVPFCCLFASGLVAWLVGRMGVWAGRVVGGVALVGGVLWGLSVMAIYTSLDTRLEATAWFRQNVPPGTRLVIEDNHRPLIPLPDATHPPETYMYNTLKVTEPDTPQKMADFAEALATGEWLVVPDRRWSAVLPRIPGFPLMGNYYRLLFDGKLGYTSVATFSDPPRLGPFTWSDDDAEETFQVFDHPTVKVFRNTERLSEATLRGLLGAGP